MFQTLFLTTVLGSLMLGTDGNNVGKCSEYSTQKDCAPPEPIPSLPECPGVSSAAYRFLAVGDYGLDSAGCELRVSHLARALEGLHGPASFVFTTGDNDYWDGTCSSMSSNIGKHFARFFTPGPGCVDPGAKRSGTAGWGDFRGVLTVQGTIDDDDDSDDVGGDGGGGDENRVSRTGEGHRIRRTRIRDADGNGVDDVDEDRFFPCLGNHDWDKFRASAMRDPKTLPYLQYFDYLAGLNPPGVGHGGQFYSKVVAGGAVELFSLNSCLGESQASSDERVLLSEQARWLRGALQASNATFRIVYFHHPPRSTAQHDPIAEWMDLPFADWGATLVMNGHQHVYERLQNATDIPYIVNGLGGHPWLYSINDCGTPWPGSRVRYNNAHGIIMGGVVDGPDPYLAMCFYSVEGGGKLVDSFRVGPRASGRLQK